MKSAISSRLRRFGKDERGQAMPILALTMVVLVGMCGVAVDVARCLFVYRQLQAATDAAAMAGAGTLPSSNAITAATNYSAVAGGLNARTSLTGAAMVTGYPKLECLNTLKGEGVACSAPANANAIEVKEQITVNLIFLRVVGLRTQTIGTSATAASRGGSTTPYNVAIIIDSTLSMQENDANCGTTQMACALNGVQVLLQSLSPCAASDATCTVTSGVARDAVDSVALFTFPNITIGSASIDTNCTTPITSAGAQQYGYYNNSALGYYSMRNQTAWSGLAQATGYTYPSSSAPPYNPTGSSNGTYEVTGFLSDYRTSDTATSLNPNSAIVKAAGGVSHCGGLAPPNFAGDYGTYYAGAIYAAAGALLAQQQANPGSQNVIIFLSDGDANAPQTFNNGSNTSPTNVTITSMPAPADGTGNYPSYKNECIQGYLAAQAAAGAGIRIYTVSYGSLTSGCSTDPSTYSGVSVNPCTVMQYMATAPQYFYSDYNQTGSNSTCYSSSQSVTSLRDIFTSIANDLTVSRLIPDNTT